MAADGTKQWRITAASPPRTLNIQKFASSRAAELESLHSIVSSRLNGDFRSQRNKRRRTTGFENKAANNRRRKRRRSGESKKEKDTDGSLGSEEKLPRRIRRRIELKKNPEVGFVACGDGTKWLRTHIWHAKRFSMTKLWGFVLPLGLHGKGKGSRALLKWYRQGTVVHDASYYSAVQLEGPEDTVLSVLRMVLDPSPMNHSVDCSTSAHSRCLLCGDVYGSSILHQAGSHPFEAICPVTYMWRPLRPQGPSADEEGCNTLASFRRLWIWIHPSALSEGYNALRTACQKKMDDTGVMVNCLSLEGQLARLDVMGLKAFPLLKKILHPVIGSAEHVSHLKKCSVTEADDRSAIKDPQILSEEQSYSSKAVVSLVVSDPRCVSAKSKASVPQPDMGDDQCKVDDCEIKERLADDCQTNEHFTVDGNVGTEDLVPASPLDCENDIAHSKCKDIWDAAGGGICPPVEENVLCTEKYHRRLSLFRLKDANSGMSNEVQGSRMCPVLLLRNTNNAGVFKGWSIILPLSWVKAFWMPLVSNGARAIGLREKQWIANDAGLPYFPSDFPDCNAYCSSKAIESAELDQKMELRPPAKRPFIVATIPPWNSICNFADMEAQPKENPSPTTSPICVARTSQMLKWFSNKDCVKQLLSSPDDTLMDEVHTSQSLDQEQSKSTCEHKKLCYLRLLLHAYKEGSFEEGAVICAPNSSDITLLRSRPENDDSKLQVPQSLLASGKWEFQLPDDPADRESYRQPLGFVTSGFVRGSKKPTAVGLAESTRLASLRQEQQSQMPMKRVKKEIYVLVRNLRSSSYRLALATVVLGRQEDDVEFL